MDLRKCGRNGCAPIEQIRGRMGPGDYFDVAENDGQHAFAERMKDPENYHRMAELDDSNKDDIRIICRKCHRTTGWNKADAPGMPGAGRDYLQRVWNDISADD